MGSNNGQRGFINEDEIYLNEGNTISFGQDTATMFYQEKPYFSGVKLIIKVKAGFTGKDTDLDLIPSLSKKINIFKGGEYD